MSFTTKSIVSGANSANNHLLYNFEQIDGLGDYTSPTVTLSGVTDGSVVARRSTVNIGALATDNLAVKNVEFYINGSLICSDTTASYSCAWKPTLRGSYVIQAKAFDHAGNVGTTTLVNVIVP